jgi:predicted ester cyclase
MANDDNKAIFQRLVDDLWNKRNLAVADELFAPNAPNNIPIAPDLPAGPAGAKALASLFHTAFPDLKVTVDRVHAMGDRVAGRVFEEGTQQGEFLGVAESGKAVDFTKIGLFRIENGKIAESWYEFDALRVMQQIGAIPGAE